MGFIGRILDVDNYSIDQPLANSISLLTGVRIHRRDDP
jgi:hypothetical protein